MRRNLLLLTISLFLFTNHTLAQDYFFKLIEPDREKVNTIITRTVSIDEVKGDTVFAYASQREFEAIKQLGYTPEILENSAHTPEDRSMATTVEAMANWNLYPTYEVYRAMMKKFEQEYPQLCKLDSIGTSVQGRQLYVVKISSNVLQDTPKPEFFYTSTMHGDETTGFVLMLRLIDYLLSNYGSDNRITDMLDQLAIYINPNANPDGTYYGGNSTVNSSRRYNANSYDINRNFPDPRVGQNPDGPYQPETIVMMNFASERNFVMSANIHGGIELANFPWDAWTTNANAHADHNWYYKISRQYADLAQENGSSGYFTGQGNGVTQGGDWYVVYGGRQDYMNFYQQCKEITLEISNTKNPNSSQLPNFWNYNKEALLSHMEWLYVGIHGTVTNAQGNPLSLNITVANHDKDNSHAVTNPLHGNYVRPIQPGTYQVTYSLEGYISQTHTITVPDYNTKVVKDVVLQLAGQTSLSGVVTDQTTGQPIEGAKILLVGSSFGSVYTNESGYYIFPAIAENTYQIKAFKEGYLSETVTKELTGASNTLNFELSPTDIESFEGGIPQGFTFTGGDWVVDNTTAYDGDFSMRSASIGNSQSTSMIITLNVVTDSEITFAYKVSSENSYDWLKFFVDGNEKGSWSGEKGWAEVTYPVSAGVHTFKWTYNKDVSSSSGSDCAWIDCINFPPSQNNVLFTVTYGGEPLQGALVTFNGRTQNTGASGLALFENHPRGAHQYTIEKDGFRDESGSLNIRYVDVNVDVEMDLANSVITTNHQSLYSIWPNPFAETLNFNLNLTAPTHVTIDVYTITGQKIATVISGAMGAGEHSVQWHHSDSGIRFTPGVYLFRVVAGEQTATQRVIFNGQ